MFRMYVGSEDFLDAMLTAVIGYNSWLRMGGDSHPGADPTSIPPGQFMNPSWDPHYRLAEAWLRPEAASSLSWRAATLPAS